MQNFPGKLLLFLFLSVVSIIACKKEKTEEPPPVSPACEIITPADSSEFQKGSLVTVETSLSGLGDGVKVVFWVDTTQIIQCTGLPYEFNWNTTEWDTGIYRIRADAIEGMTLVSDEINIILYDTIIPLQKPIAIFNITPSEGTTDTIFIFDANESSDLEDDLGELLFRWDFEGDGEWDTELISDPVITHRYFHVGHYYPTLEVMDTDTMASDTSASLVVTHSTAPDPCNGIISIPYGGKVYHTVPVGDQCWLKENLDIGIMIPSDQAQSNNDQIEKYCYNNDTSYCDKYGGLYMWNEAMKYIPFQGGRGICPAGFHMPTDDEWKELEGYADSQYGIGNPVWDSTSYRGFDAGKHLKAQLGWFSGGNGNNALGYTFKAGGYWEQGSSFMMEGEEGYSWTSTRNSANNAVKRSMKYDREGVNRAYHPVEAAMSVRCIKD